MVKPADTRGRELRAEERGGSSPSARTIPIPDDDRTCMHHLLCETCVVVCEILVIGTPRGTIGACPKCQQRYVGKHYPHATCTCPSSKRARAAAK